MTSNKRREKRERERKILAEMDAAMREQENTPKPDKTETEKEPPRATPTVHCKRCKTPMEQGVCPTCGFRIYQPMDEKLRRKIRWILTGVCLVAFVVLYFTVIK